MELVKTPTRSDYVKGLELASPNRLEQLQLKAGQLNLSEEPDSAAVVAGSTISFVSGVPAQLQQDVMNSALLAQLAANKAYDRETQTVNWYDKYKEVLENVGWIIQDFSFSRQEAHGTTVEMDKVVLDILAAAISGNELAVLKATIDALRNADPNSNQIKLFENHGSSGESGNFQMSTARLNDQGSMEMSLGAFYFHAKESQTRFLFFSWSTKDLNLYAGSQTIVLNEEIYATVRNAITEKLGDKAKTFVDSLDI